MLGPFYFVGTSSCAPTPSFDPDQCKVAITLVTKRC